MPKNKINIFLIILMLAATFITVRFYFRTQGIIRQNQNSWHLAIGKINDRISFLDTAIKELKNNQEELHSRMLAVNYEPETEIDNFAGKDGLINTAALSHELSRLKKIVDATGLNKLANSNDMNPEVLQEIYEERALIKKFNTRRNAMRERNQEQHLSDKDRYDAELNDIYDRARFMGGRSVTREEQDLAFNEMLDKYPDAYATGMLVAERALRSAFRKNFEETEKFYSMLTGNENSANIVTDRGIEALPNIEYYLARQYLREGRTAEAQAMIDSLESNYSDSLVFVGRHGQGTPWQTVDQIIPDLRTR